MTHRIEAILLAPLSVAACSSEDTVDPDDRIDPDDYGECPDGAIVGLNLASSVDGLELWKACTEEDFSAADGGAQDTAQRLEAAGERCSSEECEAELAAVVADLGGGKPAIPEGYYCVKCGGRG